MDADSDKPQAEHLPSSGEILHPALLQAGSASLPSTNPFRRVETSHGQTASSVYADVSTTNPWADEVASPAKVEDGSNIEEQRAEATGMITPPSPTSDIETHHILPRSVDGDGERGDHKNVERFLPEKQRSEPTTTNTDLVDLLASKEPTNVEIPMPGREEPHAPVSHGKAPEGINNFLENQPTPTEATEAASLPPPPPLTSKPGSETYQIRHVNWYDFSSPKNPRRSPIMVQNANGPCPLLALVNALVLSTPYGLGTALVETLRIREQVTLGLLLDAVIDELLSDRRGGGSQELPDVTELYAFLLNLHTGMNVNPRFVQEPAGAPSDIMGVRRQVSQPGGFEGTKEMKLYGTFAVPLVHGWIPQNDDPTLTVLTRSAKTFDEAQTLLFVEQDLEEKLRVEGLGEGEMQTLQDIGRIKYFLDTTATQLTEHGLNVIRENLAGGAVAILFRNDHFSTIYKNPRNGQLLTLITDMGYATRDEIVWESLVDVSGEGSSYLSGDFLPVGDNHAAQQADAYEQHEESKGWTTVGPSKRRGATTFEPPASSDGQSSSQPPDLSSLSIDDNNAASNSISAEDYDRDLALAISMQMEEEEQHAQEAERRKQEALSRAYLDKQQPGRKRGFQPGPPGRPSIPPRAPNASQSTNRSGPPRAGGLRTFPGRGARSSEDGVDNPPPTYDEAASGPAYHPPPDFAAHAPSGSQPHGPPRLVATSRASSAYVADSGTRSPRSPNSFVPPASLSGAPFRNASGRPAPRASTGGDERKDKDCIIM